MARGFWTGLVQGGLLGIAALAVLSLAAPAPHIAPDPAPAPMAAPRPEAEPQPQPAPPPEPAAAPRAGTVDLPVGSEFGRGGDVAPMVPAPLPTGRPVQPEAPAVVAPTAEPAPVAVTAADPRPQPAGEHDGPVQDAPAVGEDAPDLDRPAALAVPTAPIMPGRAMADAPDAAPVVPTDRDAVPTPGLPAPALDLSLPPDLSDLQGLSRD